MNESLETLQGEVLDRIQQSNSEREIEQLRVEILGRNGRLTLLLRGLKDLPAGDRPRAGEELNQFKRRFEQDLDERRKAVKEESKERALKEEKIDITLPRQRDVDFLFFESALFGFFLDRFAAFVQILLEPSFELVKLLAGARAVSCGKILQAPQ